MLDFSDMDSPPDIVSLGPGTQDGTSGTGSFVATGFDNVDLFAGTVATDVVSLPGVVC